MMAAVYAAAFGAIQQMPRIVPGLEEVRAMDNVAREQTVTIVNWFQEAGGLTGRILLAALAAVILSRRRLIWLFQIPGLVLLPIVFLLVPAEGLLWAQVGILLVGMATIAQMSFWGNYLPRVYPTHLRGTGESFAANVGGRMVGTFAAYVHGGAGAIDAWRDSAPQARLGRGAGRHRRLHRRRRRQLLATRT